MRIMTLCMCSIIVWSCIATDNEFNKQKLAIQNRIDQTTNNISLVYKSNNAPHIATVKDAWHDYVGHQYSKLDAAQTDQELQSILASVCMTQGLAGVAVERKLHHVAHGVRSERYTSEAVAWPWRIVYTLTSSDEPASSVPERATNEVNAEQFQRLAYTMHNLRNAQVWLDQDNIENMIEKRCHDEVNPINDPAMWPNDIERQRCIAYSKVYDLREKLQNAVHVAQPIRQTIFLQYKYNINCMLDHSMRPHELNEQHKDAIAATRTVAQMVSDDTLPQFGHIDHALSCQIHDEPDDIPALQHQQPHILESCTLQ